jgi:NADH-quinone oxidoreductase subunit G
MTRCIHCTRCVRFGQDVAGIQELGTTGRGENTEIGTFIEKSVDHELSGNIIDLCPVGALNSKPFRFSARAWEMTQHPLVSPHDGVGTNLYGHVLRGRLMRVVPRPNESINETWIADRDRFSYEGIYSDERALRPMVRDRSGVLREVDWDAALDAAADSLRAAGAETGLLAHPSSTLEELYLLSRVAAGLNSANIDHRLRQRDFSGQASDAGTPSLGLAIADIDKLNELVIVGCNLRAEAPVLAHRVRKAARTGAKVRFLNAATYDYLFPVAECKTAAPSQWVAQLNAWLQAAQSGPGRAVWLGALAQNHADYATVRSLARALAVASGASFGEISPGANAAGAYLAGVLPHRGLAGATRAQVGADARTMCEQSLTAYLLLGAEPWADGVGASAAEVLKRARSVVAITPFASEAMRAVASVILPASTFAETSGTYVNLEGRWQSVAGAAKPLGESRPGWKILRVLGNRLGLGQFDYQSSDEVANELRGLVDAAAPLAPGAINVVRGAHGHNEVGTRELLLDQPMYQVDAVVRRAASLQRTRLGMAASGSVEGAM